MSGEDETTEQRSIRGAREQDRDAQLSRLDETQSRDRMRDAQEQFIRLGLAVYLIGVTTSRGAISYSIELHRDGGRNLALRDIQAIADDLGLDLTFAGDDSGDAILVDPRPQPNWS